MEIYLLTHFTPECQIWTTEQLWTYIKKYISMINNFCAREIDDHRDIIFLKQDPVKDEGAYVQLS